MRTSQFLLATQKEIPADAEIISHQLMIRAGMIRKVAAGIYTWLPLGLRVLRRVEAIVREEMNRTGAMEVSMPIFHPADIWRESGRWDSFGPELLKCKDRHQRDFCIAPTHEETFTHFIRDTFHSYKQLPATFYQIQIKFRDEPRPRSGIMRAREFLMKDAYSLHLNQESLQQTYQVMFDAYTNIFTRLGLRFCAVLADTGSIGGSESHEFHVLADSGEDRLAISEHGDYAANLERAIAYNPTPAKQTELPLQIIDTPKQHTIEQLSNFLKVPATQCVKTLLVAGVENTAVALVLRGDHEVNDIKVQKLAGIASPLTFISPEKVKEIVGCSIGSLGPKDLTIPMIIDPAAAALINFVAGANQEDKHYQNMNWGRDVELSTVADIRFVVENDFAPDGKNKLKISRGIEVGHIFQLGDKYSKPMQAQVIDEAGKSTIVQMGCYGIGVSRIVAAAIEQNHDENGIIWPDAIAPFHIALVPINLQKSDRVRATCENLYKELSAAGYQILFADDNERAGVTFANMDLIGIPHRLVIGDRNLDAGMIEYKSRRDKEAQQISLNNIIHFLQEKIKA